MTETKKGKTSVRTAHSLNPVPFIIYDQDNKYEIKDGHYGLANVAPTIEMCIRDRYARSRTDRLTRIGL